MSRKVYCQFWCISSELMWFCASSRSLFMRHSWVASSWVCLDIALLERLNSLCWMCADSHALRMSYREWTFVNITVQAHALNHPFGTCTLEQLVKWLVHGIDPLQILNTCKANKLPPSTTDNSPARTSRHHTTQVWSLAVIPDSLSNTIITSYPSFALWAS